jgi:hypothetical protein
MINIIFRNNTLIRILAIELLNIILILVILMIKSLLKKLMVCLDNLSPCSVCCELNKVENRWSRVCYDGGFSEMNLIKNKPKLLLHNDSSKQFANDKTKWCNT